MLGLIAGMAGCSANYTTGNSALVLLQVVSVNGGSPLASDVLRNDGIFTDSVPVAIAVRFKNPNLSAPSIPSNVYVERYEVKYRRSDGRGVEGQDVPYTISGSITQGFEVKDSGVDTLNVEVVRAQAKLEPPLRNLQSGSGGGIVVTMFADITIHGRTVSGQTVTATGSLQIDFANWADK